jgi:transposase
MKNGTKHKAGSTLKTRYPESFKIKVVREVESGFLNKESARRKYGIAGKSAVLYWCRKYGRKDQDYRIMPLKKKDKHQTPDEKDQRIIELETQLAQAHLSIDALEALIEVANDIYGTNLKKKVGTRRSKR